MIRKHRAPRVIEFSGKMPRLAVVGHFAAEAIEFEAVAEAIAVDDLLHQLGELRMTKYGQGSSGLFSESGAAGFGFGDFGLDASDEPCAKSC